jgi:hypothetical protein
MPPQSRPAGRSYDEWSAAWWQWAYSLPFDHHPLTDTADCSAGQTGNVWFLGAAIIPTENPPGTFFVQRDRTCVVPAGTFLFVPAINSEAATLEGNGSTEQELRDVVTSLQNLASDMSVSIDGVPVASLDSYRVGPDAPAFIYGPLPANNVPQNLGYNAPAGATSLSVGDGVYVMVRPLTPGQHTIHFAGAVDAFNFTVDVTYHIQVVGRA